jgi:hypothetical protein
MIEALDEGAVQRVRPRVMTVAMIHADLAPLLMSEGTGADWLRGMRPLEWRAGTSKRMRGSEIHHHDLLGRKDAKPLDRRSGEGLWPIFDSLILKALVIQSVGSAAGV